MKTFLLLPTQATFSGFNGRKTGAFARRLFSGYRILIESLAYFPATKASPKIQIDERHGKIVRFFSITLRTIAPPKDTAGRVIRRYCCKVVL